MEIFNPSNLKSKAYRSAIVQKGGAIEMDRYIYGMQSEGLGNLLGSLMKRMIPLNGTTIKAASKTSKPITTSAQKKKPAGAKRRAGKIAKASIHSPKNDTIVHIPHKKRRGANKWQSL